MKFKLKEIDDVYYIENYIPVREFKHHSDWGLAFSRDIWSYKGGEEPAISYMTQLYIKAIKELLALKKVTSYIALVCAPPSKVSKYSPVKVSIKRILAYYKRLKKEGTDPFMGHIIIDDSDLLLRTKDVSSSHKERRPPIDEHKASIRCTRNNLSNKDITYLLMDDVATTGNLLCACKEILISKGADPNAIYKLVLAKTK